ncbi:unnamed protein product [Zymoseptoria tritici ST99CH_1E4]|uniref:ferric-chelate reductase (NADPH) n=1 Tax=Zymoseptoria tritici ST99CH_1E4 TaxID=1276532 RepID=A0A2H1GBK0_ZYMTR|nr:unnamed protein product [Zymoseptoria tritici ST99CH_1E4]
MWKLVDLTDEQKHLRRQKLDAYGQLAQFSALVPLLVVLLFSLVTYSKRKFWSDNDILEPPSSPYIKHRRTGLRAKARTVEISWRRFVWWCGGEVRVGRWAMGRKGDVLGGVAWGLWLAYLSVVETGDDYFHLTKRLGAIAGSQLPLQYLLAMKTPYSPMTSIFRLRPSGLLDIHQTLGRLIAIFMYAHAALYLNFYIQSSILISKLTQFYIVCGVLGVLSFTAINITSMTIFRTYSYKSFYTIHVICASALLPLLYFHVHHIRVYLYETLAIYLFSNATRFFATKTYHNATIRLLPGTTLLDISIPVPASGKEKSTWQPAQHAYLSLPGYPLLRNIRSNPFTNASLPASDSRLHFLARVLSGRTARLAAQASTGSSMSVSIEGPYGTSSHADELLRCGRVLFVAGGVGATFVVPLYRQLLGDLSPSPGSERRQKVKFLWVAKKREEVLWAVEDGGKGFVERLQVYVTGPGMTVDAGAREEAQFVIGGEEREDGIELEERKNLLEEQDVDGKDAEGLHVSSGRPDLRKEVEELFSHGSEERVAVVVCGPKSLARSLRDRVSPYVHKGRDVMFWEESFGV